MPECFEIAVLAPRWATSCKALREVGFLKNLIRSHQPFNEFGNTVSPALEAARARLAMAHEIIDQATELLLEVPCATFPLEQVEHD